MCWAGHVRTTGCFSVFISIKPSLIPPQWFLLGLFCFFFIFVSFARSFSRRASSQLWRFSETSHEGRCCYHMLSGLVRERERLWGADGLGIKRGGKKRKKKKHLHSWKSWEERALRQNAGRWRWNPLRDSKSESERSVDLQRTIVCNSFIQVYSV